MNQELHIITRYSRPGNLTNLAKSINTLTQVVPGSKLYWHILFDTVKVGDSIPNIQEEAFNVLITPVTKEAHDSYLHEGMSFYCRNNIKQGWVVFLDDDNVIHENYVRKIVPLLHETSERFIVYHQDVNYVDFKKVKIREALPENMKVGEVDLAQVTFHSSVFDNNVFPSTYTGDSELISKLYLQEPLSFKFVNAVAAYYNFTVNKAVTFLPTILYIGDSCELIKTSTLYDFSEKYLNVLYRETDRDLKQLQREYDIELYVTEAEVRNELTVLPFEPVSIRKQWIEVEKEESNKGNIIYFTLLQTIISNYNKSDLISIFTSSYNTGSDILKTYHTIRNQTNTNWEWVVVDDSTDDGSTYKILRGIAEKDSRVKVYRFNVDSQRNIGEAKYRAAMLTTGDILLELDHDDWLLPDACEVLLQASKDFGSCGFFYSDCIEIDKTFKSREYGDNWAFGYGKYRTEVHNIFGRREFVATVTPNINPRTIRHIVSMPNHLRAWRRAVYFQTKGHNRSMNIADDYELMLRTFLITEFVHIVKTLYVQVHGSTNSQNVNKPEISRRVDALRYIYRDAISARFKNLGVEDWCATEQEFLNAPNRVGEEESAVNKVFEFLS